MKTIKKKKIILTSIVIFAFLVWIFGRLIYTILDEETTSSKIPFPEYHALFSKEAQGRFILLGTTKSRNREPIASYVYEGNFNVFVSKVILSSDKDLKEAVELRNESSHISLDAVYSELPSFRFEMKLKAGQQKEISKIHVNNEGRINDVRLNDSVICVNFKFKSFSISYDHEPLDIIGKGDEESVPASLVILKKGRILYLILMTASNNIGFNRPQNVYDIIKRKTF